jgi:hypothetical protein
MTRAEQLAAFVVRASHDALSSEAREALRVRVLDSLLRDRRGEGEPPASSARTSAISAGVLRHNLIRLD